jgi:hypothetical protein
MLLLTASLIQPWFAIDDHINEVPGSRPSWELSWRIYPEYYTYTDQSATGSHASLFTSHDEIANLMDSASTVLLIGMGFAWLMTMAALANSRRFAFLFGLLTTGACLLSVMSFSMGVANAVRNSGEYLQSWPAADISGLFGKTTNLSYSQTQMNHWSWQPGWGWFFAVMAVILLAAAVFLVIHGYLRYVEEDRITRLADEQFGSVSQSGTEVVPAANSPETGQDERDT